MTEFPFVQSMYCKATRYITVTCANDLSGGKFPPSGGNTPPKRVSLVSTYSLNWKYFEYISTVYKTTTPGGVTPVEWHLYYNADMDVFLRLVP